MMNLRERAEQLKNTLPFMKGREKGEMKRIVGMNCTIRDYGFMKDEHGDEYVCFIIDEDSQYFYFGGMVLTENMQALEADGYHNEIVKDGLPVLFDTKIGKNKREYTTVTYYPETEKDTKKK